MSFFSKKENQISRVNPGYEETENRTPKAGYILLIAMFFAAIFFGWRALDDLQNVPMKPESLSQCSSPFLTYTWEDYGRFNYELYPQPEVLYTPKPFGPPSRESGAECVFSKYENNYGISAIFSNRKNADKLLSEKQNSLNSVTQQIYDLDRQYGLGLGENISGEDIKLFPTAEIRKNLQEFIAQKQTLDGEIASLRSQLTPYDDQLKELYKRVLADYRGDWHWYEFYVFLLEMLFIFPFFALIFVLYRKLLARHSPYTIIFTALIGVAAVLFLRVMLVWFWGLFLARLIEELWNFIQNFAILKSLVFYGGMLLSIGVFGGAVYLLQKRIFDPRRIAIRRTRQKQCPQCQTSLDISRNFCPNCGRQIREECLKCKQARFSDMPFCPSCGAGK